MAAKAIMVQGTGSDVGKSIIAAALCRIFRQDGYRVAPFKSQNMALNSFVTKDGYEIGRAQVVQAEAAGIDPMVEMNPILLKPTGDSKSQVVVMGKPFMNMSAKEYYRERDQFLDIIKTAYHSLSEKFDIIVIEGAGSPAEINIKERDVVNMKMAEIADAPVLLVTDIDRGGAFAWIVGTLQLLSESERKRVAGVIFNKFRGDIDILKSGYAMLENIINKPVLGTMRFLDDLRIDDEDSVSLDKKSVSVTSGLNNVSATSTCRLLKDNSRLEVVVIKLPRISNFTDFDLLNREPSVSLRYVKDVNDIGSPDLIIIPGTKGTINDLKFIKDNGMADVIRDKANNGCMVIGICGGYQMLGKEIRDPLHVESNEERISGIGLINAITDFAPEKVTHQSRAKIMTGSLPFEVNRELTGYEIHMGTTRLLDFADNGYSRIDDTGTKISIFLKILKRSSKSVDINDGISIFNKDKFIIGSYLHGIFDNDDFRSGLIRYLANRNGKKPVAKTSGINSLNEKEEGYKRLEKIVRESLDMDHIYKILNKT